MKRTFLYGFAKIFVQWFLKWIIRYRVNDNNHMPAQGRVIVCCNHLAFSDPVRLAFTQHRQIFFMSKAELFENRFLKWLLSSLGAFPVQRGKGDKSALNRAGELLEEERALGIFIEGTRSKTGEFLQPKAGAAMLAYHYHAPVLPACITPRGGGLPKLFRLCVVSYGTLMQPEELGLVNGTGSEFRNASREIMDQIEQLRERDLNAMEKA